jgi:hypothetical protein
MWEWYGEPTVMRVFEARFCVFIYLCLFGEDQQSLHTIVSNFNPLNAELNPIYHLMALLGAHHILHVSGLRVK